MSAQALATFAYENDTIHFCDIAATTRRYGTEVSSIPFSMRILIENLERQRITEPGGTVCEEDVEACVRFEANRDRGITLKIPRAILPDSSGIPVLQSLASLRDSVAESGGDPEKVTPQIPVDLIVDHSLQVDFSHSGESFQLNLSRELERNHERYRFLRWAEQAFSKLRIFPPGSGIIHQINMEHLASVVMRQPFNEGWLAHPDFVLGGDSHTPMVNGIGVLGWGVGGIDIEVALLGLPYDFPIPAVVGVYLEGEPQAGVTTTDVVLTLTHRLRQEGVVASFVEFFGPGLTHLSVPERCTISNMSPEYGATAAYFPIDDLTLDYLEKTRGQKHRAFTEAYVRANALFRTPNSKEPSYSRRIVFNLAEVGASVAGPRRPQDRLNLGEVAEDFRKRLDVPLNEGGFAVPVLAAAADASPDIRHGAIAIAAITSCTNTSNPSVMIAAGLLARNAVKMGLRPPAYVKTSLAPGSRAVTQYLSSFGLLEHLELLGFHVVGYGCTTCAGKSGPLNLVMESAIRDHGIVASAVLSGNRNFEGRIHRLVRANYIMSPPLVAAYSLAGRIDLDLQNEPLGHADGGAPVFLKDIWPDADEIESYVEQIEESGVVRSAYKTRSAAHTAWEKIEQPEGIRYQWDPQSTYLLRAPFFDQAAQAGQDPLCDRLENARVVGLFGDSLTTDHISPSGEIPPDSASGTYLRQLGVAPRDFNTYVGRRGNHEVMARATFANVRIKNLLVPGREGGFSKNLSKDGIDSFFNVAIAYQNDQAPSIVVAGKEYGTGSSRDWAAKGTALLGIKAIIAQSYERIHRSNLIGMGVLPLLFGSEDSWARLGLDGTEYYTITGIRDGVIRREQIDVMARKGTCETRFQVTVDAHTEQERRLLLRGGMAGMVLDRLAAP